MIHSAEELRSIADLIDTVKKTYDSGVDLNISEVVLAFTESRELAGRISDHGEGDFQYESFVPAQPREES